MGLLKRQVVDVLTDDGAGATVYSREINGYLHSIRYIKDGSVAFTNGVDFAITAERTGVGLWTESNVDASAQRNPRTPVHDASGVVITGAASPIPLIDERVKIIITNGGNAKAGRFEIVTVDP